MFSDRSKGWTKRGATNRRVSSLNRPPMRRCGLDSSTTGLRSFNPLEPGGVLCHTGCPATHQLENINLLEVPSSVPVLRVVGLIKLVLKVRFLYIPCNLSIKTLSQIGWLLFCVGTSLSIFKCFISTKYNHPDNSIYFCVCDTIIMSIVK